MPRISAKSNPTGIFEIDERDVEFVIENREGMEQFRLISLKFSARKIPESCEVVAIVRAGQTFNRLVLGPISGWDKTFRPLKNLDPSSVRRIRLLIHPPDQPRLVASAEKLILRGEGDRDSMLPMIGQDLGELSWRLSRVNEEYVILYNSRIFSSVDGIAQYTPFTALVLPEALRQVLTALANSDDLEEDPGPWSGWLAWLRHELDVDPPPTNEAHEDTSLIEEWVNNAVVAFCDLYKLGSSLHKTIIGEAE